MDCTAIKMADVDYVIKPSGWSPGHPEFAFLRSMRQLLFLPCCAVFEVYSVHVNSNRM